MENIHQWVHQNINYFFFIYGLSFLVMGIAILLMPKKESKFHLSKILWLLAVYAFLHSIGDFVTIISDIKEETKNNIGLIFSSVSYLFLFEFGRRLFNLSKKILSWWLLPVCILLTLSISMMSVNYLNTVHIFIGYLIRFPAGIMVSIGIIYYYNSIKNELKNKNIKVYFIIVSIAMFSWAILCGIFRNQGNFFPANIINTTTFFEFTGFPVQLFRTIASIFVTISLFGILDIFKWELVYRLQEVQTNLEQHQNTLKEQIELKTSELAESNQKLQFELSEKDNILVKEKELNMLKSRFISAMSHEFRTPLSGILTSAGLIKLYGDKWSLEKKNKLFESINGSIKYLNLLLDDVSFIGKDESGRLEYNPREENIIDFCKQIVEEISFALNLSENRIELIIETTIKEMNIDSYLMHHILTNLLSNAIRYSENNYIGLTVEDNQKEMIFIITDKGIGIPKDELKYVFEPFYRGENTGNIKGTGLGLSIVKRCVEMHNGKIELNSEEGNGTEVKIILNIT